MEKKEEEFLIMAISKSKKKLIDELKRVMIETKPKISENFMKSNPYYIRVISKNELGKSVIDHKDITEEEFVNSFKNKREGVKYDFRKQIFLNGDNEKTSDKNIAKSCFDLYKQGSGNEFKWRHYKENMYPPKMAAIHSSSMLCFNAFFRVNKDNPITIKGVEYDKVVFEAKLHTLKTSNACANMDAVLISTGGETILFIESKFTETFETHSRKQIMEGNNPKLSRQYLESEKYFNILGEGENNVLGKKWVQFINDIKEDETVLPITGSHFDLKQDLCHCIGIYNFVNRSYISNEKFAESEKWKFINKKGNLSKLDLTKISKYNFMNLEYEPDEGEYRELHDCYNSAKQYGLEFGKKVKPNIFNKDAFNKDISFNYYFYSYKEFANECLPEGKHKELFMKKYLLK